MTRRAALLAALYPLLAAAAGLAHDTGFGHSRRTIYIAEAARGLLIEYRIQLAPEEALLELAAADTDGDGAISPQERTAALAAKGRRLAASLACTAGQAAVPLESIGQELHAPLVQIYRFTIATPARSLVLEDRNFPHKPGVVQVRSAGEIRVELPPQVDLSHVERVRLKVTRLGR